jgi:manganese transport protein
LFGVALLCAGQSSTLTGTLAGQIIMEGYLDLKIAPWLRRLITRSVALIPAVLTIVLVGEQATQHLLVLSQVILSLQLAFAVIPLIHFTSNRRNMGVFATPWWGQVLAWASALVIVALNAKLVMDKIGEWVEMASESGRTLGPVPLSWVVAGSLYGIALSALCLLVWVTIKPFVKPAPAWKPEPKVELDWADALRPREVSRIGVALERGPGDSEILSHALSFAEPGKTILTILHVVDTPMTRVYGSETADRETEADERYLAEVVKVLETQGYKTHSILLYGPDRASKLIRQLKAEPVDLLVVGSHGHGMFQDLLFGQTVDKVRHGLTIPMLIARPGLDSKASKLS